MKKIFLLIIVVLFCCLWLACREGLIETGGIAVISKNIDVGLPTQGLIAYYPFNNNADDASGNGNNGTNGGFYRFGANLTADRFGRPENAYTFGPYSYTYGPLISIPNPLSDTCSSFTFCSWIKRKPQWSDKENIQFIFFSTDDGPCSLSLDSNILCFEIDDFYYGKFDTRSTNVIELGKYYFITCRYVKGQKMELIINGIINSYSNVPNGSLGPLSIVPNYGSPFMIGTAIDYFITYPTSFYGVIDDIRIYNRALSDTEVVSLFHEGGWAGN